MDEKGDHQTEELHGLRQGKAQNEIEELLFERWGSRVANIKLSNTVQRRLVPGPATPMMVPATINLAAVSVSWETTLVWNAHLVTWRGSAVGECLDGLLRREADRGLIKPLLQEQIRTGDASRALVLCIFSISHFSRRSLGMKHLGSSIVPLGTGVFTLCHCLMEDYNLFFYYKPTAK